MLSHSELIAFIATAQPQTARQFYGEVLELSEEEDSPFALVFNASGTSIRIQKVSSLEPAPFTVLGWSVCDIAETARRLINRGVSFERFDGMLHDELGVWQSPSGARVAWFKDPDGNILSLTQQPDS